MTISTGVLLGQRYRLGRRIAVGGMGEVWEAADTRLDRAVAVKVLRPELSADPEFLDRFRAEARTTAALNHPGIAAVHDYGEAPDDGAYLVMELVPGEPLAALLARAGRLGAAQTLDVLEQAGRALQAAHERGLVHRDVKPGNILLTPDGQVKLTDFGIAKAVDAAPLTRSGMVMGTAHYIAPEQAAGAEAGPAADVYSLGIVGYECLAGHRPFRSDNAMTVAMAHLREQPPPLPPDVPGGVRALIEAALVKNPGRRYPSGGEFAAAVAAVRTGRPLPLPARGVAHARDRAGTRPPGALLLATPPSGSYSSPATAYPPSRPYPPSEPYPPSGPLTGGSPGEHRGAGRRRGAWIALTVAVVLALLGYTVFHRFDGIPGHAQGQAAPSRPVAPTTSPRVAPTTTRAPTTTHRAPTTSATPASFDENAVNFVGRSADVAVARLSADGLVPRVRTLYGSEPGSLGSCYVFSVSPTRHLHRGQTVTVTCQGFGL